MRMLSKYVQWYVAHAHSDIWLGIKPGMESGMESGIQNGLGGMCRSLSL